jgi:sulfite reductase beta subunit-like hemoprotein
VPELRASGLRRYPHGRDAEKRLAHIQEPISLSIIGCVVNGPGEATMTDLGFTGGGKDAGMMYVSGKWKRTFRSAFPAKAGIQSLTHISNCIRSHPRARPEDLPVHQPAPLKKDPGTSPRMTPAVQPSP